MASIRVGFFEDFREADTLLIDVDRECLDSLIAWFRELTSSRRRVPLDECPTRMQAGLRVDVDVVPTDAGLVRSADGAFVWRRSIEGWMEIVEKLAAMDGVTCHQYLDGPRDDVQVLASIGEYGDAWWRRHER